MKKLLISLALLPLSLMAGEAQAQRLDTIHNNGNSAKTYCESKLAQKEMNHFWGETEAWDENTRITGYIIHNNDVYRVGTLKVTKGGRVFDNNFCDDVRKVSRLDEQKSEYQSGRYLFNAYISGGYETTLWTQEDNLKNLVMYRQWNEGEVKKETYRNLAFVSFPINLQTLNNNSGPAVVDMSRKGGKDDWR